jgi:hypothetical protein
VSANLSQPTPISSARGEGSYLWCRLTKVSRHHSKDTDCHNIDLIHVTKNVFDNIIETLLDITRKMKDELKSRNDLVQFGLRPELHPMLRANGKHYIPLPLASYSLTNEEKKAFCSDCMGCEYPQVSHPTSAN